MSGGDLVLIGLVAAALVMYAVWACSVRIGNAGIVDVAWAANFSLLAGLYALLASGYALRRMFAFGMVTVWSLRLASHLAVRIARLHPVEDGRYQQLRKDWGERARGRFFVFFQAQGLLDVLLSAPFLLACLNPEPRIRWIEWVGLGLWALSVTGEATADRQLDRFKADPAQNGRVCQVGLWRYSRHPNYFFEWLVWCGYFVFALGSAWGWSSAYCPLLMLFFLFRVTGIPATEAQALRSKGDAYREYQRTTSAFVPWPPLS